MLKHRVIPLLLISNNELVKTQKFTNPKYVGDPINAIKIFNEKEVDELIVLDIDASKHGREPNYKLVGDMASECFMPLCYGGGIESIDQAHKLFSIGIEKISIQTSAIRNVDVVTKIAKQYGSQSVVVSVDIKRNWLGKRKVFVSSLNKSISLGWQEYLKILVEAGAGEIAVNSIDHDGMMKGMDLELIQEAASLIPIPMIAAGGVGSLADIKEAIQAGANAVAVGSFFVLSGPHRAVLITYPNYKDLELLIG